MINHKNYGGREEFDEAVHHSLIAAGVEIVCLAGFMRILSGNDIVCFISQLNSLSI